MHRSFTHHKLKIKHLSAQTFQGLIIAALKKRCSKSTCSLPEFTVEINPSVNHKQTDIKLLPCSVFFNKQRNLLLYHCHNTSFHTIVCVCKLIYSHNIKKRSWKCVIHSYSKIAHLYFVKRGTQPLVSKAAFVCQAAIKIQFGSSCTCTAWTLTKVSSLLWPVAETPFPKLTLSPHLPTWTNYIPNESQHSWKTVKSPGHDIWGT